MRRYNLAVLGISETHWTQAVQQRLNTGDAAILRSRRRKCSIHSGSCSNAVQSSPKCICRMGISRIQNHQSIIQNKEGGDLNEYYPMLCTHQSIIEKCPRKDLTILMGDLNAEVGIDNTGYQDIMGRHGLTGREKRKWRWICKSMFIQQIGHRRHNISTQTYTQSYIDLTGPHYREPDRSYLHQ
ncbi:unnamed protein product [Schistosoma intercalatum]|nr:unnamed protein product [Schistosoma intercalatum]